MSRKDAVVNGQMTKAGRKCEPLPPPYGEISPVLWGWRPLAMRLALLELDNQRTAIFGRF